MGYDLEFECGRHEWHNIWVLEGFSLILAYAIGKIDRDELENRITAVAMDRTIGLGDSDKPRKEPKLDERGRPQFDSKITLMQLDPEDAKTALLVGEVVRNGKVWAAVVEGGSFDKCPEELEKLVGVSIRHRERMDEYIELIDNPGYTALSQQSGGTVDPSDAMWMMYQFMVHLQTQLLVEMDEYLPEMGRVSQLVGHLAYSGGGGIPFIVT